MIFKKKKPTFSHDSFFKHFYSDPKLAKELFQLIFSKKSLKACNWNKLKIEKDTFEDKRADLIFSIPLTACPRIKLRIFILLEHKAYYDKGLYSQLLRYQVLMREHHIQHLGKAMPVLSVLFYHGREPIKWSKTLQEEDFLENLSQIPFEFRKIMLNYGIKILDVKSPIVRGAYKNLRSRFVIQLLSEIWSLKNPNPEKIKSIFVGFKGLLKEASGQRRGDMVLKILEYLTDNAGLDLKTWKSAEELMVGEGILTKGGVMDIREHIKEKGRWEGQQEGMKKGMEKGKQEVVSNMLKKQLDFSLISEVTGLSEVEIKKLKNGSCGK